MQLIYDLREPWVSMQHSKIIMASLDFRQRLQLQRKLFWNPRGGGHYGALQRLIKESFMRGNNPNKLWMYNVPPTTYVALTEFSLELAEAAQRLGDKLSVLALYVLQDVLPVQAEGVRGEQGAVEVRQ